METEADTETEESGVPAWTEGMEVSSDQQHTFDVVCLHRLRCLDFIGGSCRIACGWGIALLMCSGIEFEKCFFLCFFVVAHFFKCQKKATFLKIVYEAV